MSSPDYWDKATKALSKRDPVMKKLIQAYKGEALATRGDAFFTLARAIAGQQISVKAADSVWRKLSETLGGKVTPRVVLKATPEHLRAAGLSQQKINYLISIAAHFEASRERVKAWPELNDEALVAELVVLKGVGRWTAEMLLIFHFLRPDVFPAADLGLLKAVARHYKNGEKVTRDEALAIAENWRPWRTVATWYLWRALDPLPVSY